MLFRRGVNEPVKANQRVFTHVTPSIECFCALLAMKIFPLLDFCRQCNVAQTPVHVLMFWFGVGALAVVTTATGTLHIFDTLFDLTIHQLIITTLITVLGIFGNMCYTGMLLIYLSTNLYGSLWFWIKDAAEPRLLHRPL